MSTVIVISELHQVPPAERWSRLIVPLSEELESSGLGRILDFDTLRQQAIEFGRIDAEELAVELVDLGYGRELVKRVISAAGVKRRKAETPKRWLDYRCQEYFSSQLAQHGCWDEAGQLWLIEPAERVEEEVEAEFLQIGRPGVDSIVFGYRKGKPGFWAYHRMVDQEFQYLAPTIMQFLDGWSSGEIRL
jgi:hypothetical protein